MTDKDIMVLSSVSKFFFNIISQMDIGFYSFDKRLNQAKYYAYLKLDLSKINRYDDFIEIWKYEFDIIYRQSALKNERLKPFQEINYNVVKCKQLSRIEKKMKDEILNCAKNSYVKYFKIIFKERSFENIK